MNEVLVGLEDTCTLIFQHAACIIKNEVQSRVFVTAPPIFTSIDDLPTHSQHNLTVAGCIRHQIQHLLVGTSLHHHTIDADELVSSSQTSILLCSSVWHNSPDVHLRKDVLMEE